MDVDLLSALTDNLTIGANGGCKFDGNNFYFLENDSIDMAKSFNSWFEYATFLDKTIVDSPILFDEAELDGLDAKFNALQTQVNINQLLLDTKEQFTNIENIYDATQLIEAVIVENGVEQIKIAKVRIEE